MRLYSDTDQSVEVIVAEVTIDTDRWQICNGNVYRACAQTVSDHVSLYGDIVRRVLVALLIVLSITMEEDEEMVGRQLNSGLEELEPSS